GIAPLTDQGIAGSIVMGEGMIVTLAVLAWAFLKWAADTTERQRLMDLAEAQGVELDEARAARAVAAGQARDSGGNRAQLSRPLTSDPAAKLPTMPEPPRLRRTSIAIIVLASVVAFFAVFAVWAKRQILETDTWTQTSTKVLANHDVQEAL